MAIKIRKLPNQDLYRVYDNKTRYIHAYATTLQKAQAQAAIIMQARAQARSRSRSRTLKMK